MRLGLDLTGVGDPDERLARAVEADRLGLWAVLVGGVAGKEAVEAAAIATDTSSIHLAVLLDGRRGDHPLTLAEELAVLDHLSERRTLGIIDGPPDIVDHIDRLLGGEIVAGVAVTPPPAQTRLTVWSADTVERVELTGDVDTDGTAVDRYRDAGCTHLFVTWPGPLLALTRHLATRAVGPGFPAIVAEWADRLAPPDPEPT